MPNFTLGQTRALEMIQGLREYKDEPRICVLAGFAGAGKTYLIQFIPQEMKGMPMMVAPTGKAASRIKDLTGLTASTIHSWIYSAREDQWGEVSYSLKEPNQIKAGEVPLLVCDEASMVGEDLWEDIYSTCCALHMNILLIGDPFQLPPVQEKGSDDTPRQGPEFNLMSPDFQSNERLVLTEILRQAQESPIIRASMMVRDGGVAKAVMALPRIKPAELAQRAAENYRKGGVTLAHKNATRLSLNQRIRSQLDLPQGEIVAGEPLLVIQNNIRAQIYNGDTPIFQTWVEGPGAPHDLKDPIRKESARGSFGKARVQGQEVMLCPERTFGQLEQIRNAVFVKRVAAVYGTGALDPEDLRGMSAEEINENLGPPFLDTNLGYVLTVHKAQGSEWKNVVICLESSVPMKKEEGLRWMYTAITRARDSVSVCLGGS